MIRRILPRGASVNSAGAPGYLPVSCIRWVVEDAEILSALRVGATRLAILLFDLALFRHRLLSTLPR